MPPLSLAILGCGSRGRTYARLAALFPDSLAVVAAADPNPQRLAQVAAAGEGATGDGLPNFRSFSSDEELFAAGRLADVLIISTQDAQHHRQALRALALGYDLLLEKPAAQSIEEILEIRQLAEARQARVSLCFVLRYTPFYRAVKQQIDSGRLGNILHIEASEGVGAFHQAHSFVRGHWSRPEESTPMIVQKCSHDTDILAWLKEGTRPRRVTSHGSLSWFRPENAPPGATARCTAPCPHAQPRGGTCRYDSHRYLTDQRRWLDFVYPEDATQATDDDVLAWLDRAPWGRCAWGCDNTAVDHQIVGLEFDDGATASLSMSAFDRGRQLTVHGTEGTLRGGEGWTRPGTMELWFRPLDAAEAEAIPLPAPTESAYLGHGGGDYGLIESLPAIFAGAAPGSASLQSSLDSHLIAFAAELSRQRGGQPIDLADLLGDKPRR